MFNFNEDYNEDYNEDLAAKPAPCCHDGSCPAEVHDTVCVQADVSISPEVKIGKIKTTCVGQPVIGPCRGEVKESCNFTVSQNIRVDIPLTFMAHAKAEPRGIACGTPGTGPCK